MKLIFIFPSSSVPVPSSWDHVQLSTNIEESVNNHLHEIMDNIEGMYKMFLTYPYKNIKIDYLFYSSSYKWQWAIISIDGQS